LPTPDPFFDQRLPAALDADPGLFDLGLALAFDIAGAGSWTVRLRGPRPACVPGLDPGADCRFAMSAATAAELVADPRSARSMFLERRIQVDGPLTIAQHLPAVLTLASASELPGGLAALVGPARVESLLRGWPEAMLVEHLPLARVGALAGEPLLGSVDALLAGWPRHVRRADRRAGQAVDVARARQLYAAGEHLAFSDVEEVVPRLRAWLARLAWELRLPVSTYGRCLAYASPDRAGEGLHFDQNVNFVLQLRGRKRWTLAENRHVRRPTTRYTAAEPVVPAAMRTYAPARLPTEMPDHAQAVVLEPGSLLLLPAGHWHATEALGDSLSLNFTFDQPCWADALGEPRASSVIAREEWRALATGAGSAHQPSAAAAAAHLQSLLRGSGQPALEALDASHLLASLRPAENAEQVVL
jgi:50S ribosomal protein L16 3-hydroxylase